MLRGCGAHGATRGQTRGTCASQFQGPPALRQRVIEEHAKLRCLAHATSTWWSQAMACHTLPTSPSSCWYDEDTPVFSQHREALGGADFLAVGCKVPLPIREVMGWLFGRVAGGDNKVAPPIREVMGWLFGRLAGGRMESSSSVL